MSDRDVCDRIKSQIARLENMLDRDEIAFDVACRIAKLQLQLASVGLPAVGVEERERIAA